MPKKQFIYDINILSTEDYNQYEGIPVAYTNDRKSAEFVFNILDLDLTNATAEVILYMRDGSFFQNKKEDGVAVEGSSVTYTMKENEGNHSGVSKAQVVIFLNDSDYSSPKVKFKIENGLEQEVAVEAMIQDWNTIKKDAREFAEKAKAAEGLRVQAEKSRKEAETSRVNAESARVTAETSRVDAEASRVTAESNRETLFSDMQITHDLDTGKNYKMNLEVYKGLPRLKLEEVL